MAAAARIAAILAATIAAALVVLWLAQRRADRALPRWREIVEFLAR